MINSIIHKKIEIHNHNNYNYIDENLIFLKSRLNFLLYTKNSLLNDFIDVDKRYKNKHERIIIREQIKYIKNGTDLKSEYKTSNGTKEILIYRRHKKIVNSKSIILNLKFDIINNLNKIPYTINRIKLIREKDDNKYKLSNKQTHYKDISIIQILKILREKHTINNYDFKECIRIEKHNNNIKELLKGYSLNVLLDNIKFNFDDVNRLYKKFSQKVTEHINAYYSTIKATTKKNTLKYLNQTTRKEKPFIIITYKNLNYKVILKRNYYFYKYYLNYATNHLSNIINNEFIKKVAIDNKFKSIYTD